MLASVGDALQNGVRASDFVARSGGEEFVVLLPDTTAKGAGNVAEKLREALHTIDIPLIGRPVTASFGVAATPEHAVEPETLMRIADRALYRAKEDGRDRVVVAGAETTAGARSSETLPAS